MSHISWKVLAAAALLGAVGAYRATAAGPERIVVSAAKFDFSAAEIRVRKGRPVTLVLTSADFPHGFSVPDFGARVDLVPGKAVELTFTPDRTGRFVFLCDNFCGEGHDRMTGFLVVTES
jgi:cytochrome c oxidase subunit 2